MRLGRAPLRKISVAAAGFLAAAPARAEAGLLIDTNKYVANQEFHGVKKLVLDNVVQDASFLHEPLAYQVFEAMGITSPQISYTREEAVLPGPGEGRRRQGGELPLPPAQAGGVLRGDAERRADGHEEAWSNEEFEGVQGMRAVIAARPSDILAQIP